MLQKIAIVKSLRILMVTFDSKLTFESHLHEVVSQGQEPWCRAPGRKLCDCPRVLRSCFNAYVLSKLEYCAPVWMTSAETHLSLLDSVLSTERLCEGKLCCLRHRRKGSALRLHYKIYHRADHPLHEKLHHFVAARNI